MASKQTAALEAQVDKLVKAGMPRAKARKLVYGTKASKPAAKKADKPATRKTSPGSNALGYKPKLASMNQEGKPRVEKPKGVKTPPLPKPRPGKNMVPKGGKVDMQPITGGKTVKTAGVDKLKAGAVSQAAAKKSSDGASPKKRKGVGKGKAFLAPKKELKFAQAMYDESHGR